MSVDRRRFAVFRRLSVALASGVLLSAVATASGSASPGPQHLAHSIAGSGHWTAIAERVHSDGTVEDVWRDATGTEVTAVGLPGLLVTVTPDTITRGSGESVNHSIAVGITRTISKTSFAAAGGGSGATRLMSSIYTTVCASVKSSDGHVYTYGCDTLNLDQTSGADWYLADQHSASSRSDCSATFTCDHLRQVNEWETWVSGNQVTQWTPGSTTSVGSCTNLTISYTSSRTGAGISESQDICPNTFGPYVLNSIQFGSIWKGVPPKINNYYESAESEDEVHNPPNVATSLTYRVGMGWCSWC